MGHGDNHCPGVHSLVLRDWQLGPLGTEMGKCFSRGGDIPVGAEEI